MPDIYDAVTAATSKAQRGQSVSTPSVPRESAAELESVIAQENQHHQATMTRLQGELDEMKKRGFTPTAIAEKQKEIDAFNQVHTQFLGKYQANLKARQDHDQQQAQAELEEQRAAAAKAQGEFKERARTAFLNAGGDPDQFEKAFPRLWEVEVERRTLASLQKAPTMETQRVRNMLNGG